MKYVVLETNHEVITKLQVKLKFSFRRSYKLALCGAMKSFMRSHKKASGEARISFRRSYKLALCGALN